MDKPASGLVWLSTYAKHVEHVEWLVTKHPTDDVSWACHVTKHIAYMNFLFGADPYVGSGPHSPQTRPAFFSARTRYQVSQNPRDEGTLP